MNPKLLIGVIGAGRASQDGMRLAEEVGCLLAQSGAVLICGGLGGVMEAACRGAVSAGGETIGLIPGADWLAANPYVRIVLPTGLGHARNVLICQAARALIAIEGEYGTLSEMAIALKLGRPVVALNSWNDIPGVHRAETAAEAVSLALQLAGPGC
ncbi:MAG: TIGR00725 family protein [Deltaproteobacteria bacterium]|nr:MAG: TIGR00725 family protein [Deltaproteobacteria bacterium]